MIEKDGGIGIVLNPLKTEGGNDQGEARSFSLRIQLRRTWWTCGFVVRVVGSSIAESSKNRKIAFRPSNFLHLN
jgi:hypothetical protein